MEDTGGKVMTAQEAVSRFIHDGDQLVIGNYTVGSCAEMVYEVARQQKKGCTLYSRILRRMPRRLGSRRPN